MSPLERRIADLLTPTRQVARLLLADAEGDIVLLVARRMTRRDAERVKAMVEMLVEEGESDG